MLDVTIRNGRIIDGTGNPWFIGDIGMKEGRITHVGNVSQESVQTIDAHHHVVSPGFIDGHSHSDLMIADDPLAEIKLQQGVTTEVVGNCGLGPAPCCADHAQQLHHYVQPVLGATAWEWSWKTIDDYLRSITTCQPSINMSTYVAHGALRIAVMGFEKRPANKQEMEQMKSLLEEGLRAGAIGLSIGLLYAPGSYTTKEEIAELCAVLPKHNGLLATHIRGEGNTLLSSIREVIWIAAHSGASLHVSHLKAAGKRNWGTVERAMELIEAARQSGMDVTCDVYPYSAGSTMLTTVLPPWVQEGGMAAVLERLSRPALRERIKHELREEQDDWDNLIASTGWHSVYIAALPGAAHREQEGKHVLQIAEEWGIDPEDVVFDLLLAADGHVSIVYFHMSENDVRDVIRWDQSCIISDSLGCVTGLPHPRLYGTFPRLFAKYVREENVLTLEQAVRKVTSFPARRFSCGRRGLLLPGYRADIVIFDPERMDDTATYEQPRQFPEGISHVFVNGVETIRQRIHSRAREGTVIRSRIDK